MATTISTAESTAEDSSSIIVAGSSPVEVLHNAKILIVDDEQVNVLLLKRILQGRQFANIASTTDSREARALFMEFQPDLVLTDWLMPHVDGFALVEQIRALTGIDEYLPIIVLTADTTPQTRQRALAAGATDFLTKPFDHLTVLLRIANLLQARLSYLRVQEQNKGLEESVWRRTIELEKALTDLQATQHQVIQQERLAALGSMAAGIAHDLNNILLPIMMTAPVLRGEIEPAERDKFLDIVESSAQRGADIIKQMLTFARGADGDHVLLQPIYLLEEVAKIAGQTFPKLITLRTSYDEHIRSLEADPTQLHQVLLNLCINARDAMPNGGQLCLGVENFDVDEHYASMTPGATAGPHVMLQVTDTGSGIPKDVIGKIFDPFFTTKNIGDGTGLGLSTVAGIVKGHGGFINLSSEPGHTSFKIFLPAQASLGAAGAISTETIVPGGNGQTILVVDDESNIRQVAQRILESYGYKVFVAEDGPTALALFAQQMGHIAVVVTDLAMPIMDGLMLVRALRRMEPGLKVIVATGRTNDSQATEMAALSVDACLTKPFTTRNLLLKLSQVLHGGLQDAA